MRSCINIHHKHCIGQPFYRGNVSTFGNADSFRPIGSFRCLLSDLWLSCKLVRRVYESMDAHVHLFFFSLYYYSLWIKASSSRNTADQSSVNLSNVLLNLWSLLKDVRIAIEQYRSKPIVQSRLFYVWTWLPIRLLFWSPYCSRWRRWLPLVRQAGLRCAGAVLL